MQVNGAVASDLAQKVNFGDVVHLDFEELRASPQAAVLLHKPYGSPATIVHPPELHVVMPLRLIERGAEVHQGVSVFQATDRSGQGAFRRL